MPLAVVYKGGVWPNGRASFGEEFMRLLGRRTAMRLAEISDAELIVSMRQDARRNEFLSPVSGDIGAQAAWLERYKARERDGLEFYFVIEDERCGAVGLVRVYEIENGSFTWGSWIIAPSAPSHCAIESALMVYDFAFGRLGLNHCHFEVRKGNERVWAFHERMGATRTAEDDIQFFYEMTPEAYYSVRPRYSKFLPAVADQVSS